MQQSNKLDWFRKITRKNTQNPSLGLILKQQAVFHLQELLT